MNRQSYMKEYREKHREQIRLQRKQYRSRPEIREYIRRKNKEWTEVHHEEKKLYNRDYIKQHVLEVEAELLKHFSLMCLFCGKRDKKPHLGVSFHEIYGRSHDRDYLRFHYVLAHHEDFAPVCNKHHRLVHLLMDYDFSWKEIREILLRKRQSNEAIQLSRCER